MASQTPPTREAAPTAGLVMIGNEILSGKIEDTNAPYLCRELRFLGVDVQRIVTIPDDFDLIAQTVHEYSEAFSWVFTSGGIGPTHDDMTVPAIAAGFGVEAVLHPTLEAALHSHYGERLTEAHLRMALLPEGAELIEVDGLSYPQIQFHNIFILPGVPELFRYKFNAIKSRFAGSPATLREFFLKADEGTIAEILGTVAERYGEVLIGSYPSFFREKYSVKVTVEGWAAEDVAAAFADLERGFAELSVRIVDQT